MSSEPSGGASVSMKVPDRDAFAETSDPTAYVSRNATDSVLSDLEDWAANNAEGSTVAALIGPPGLGKTFLLKVLEARLNQSSKSEQRSTRTLYLPYAGLSPTELTAWVYGLLGRAQPSPKGSEVEQAVGESGPILGSLLGLSPREDDPFYLLIDDADSMPTQTLRAFLAELPHRSSTLRLLLVMNDDSRASRLLAGFESLSPEVVRLKSPMTEGETRDYVSTRLAWAGAAPSIIERLDSEMSHRIFALSAGIPRTVHRIASSLFAEGEAAIPGDLDTKQRRENWMGQPFDDELF